jgi:hypothetical protein
MAPATATSLIRYGIGLRAAGIRVPAESEKSLSRATVTAGGAPQANVQSVPLVVDPDATLVASNLLIEGKFSELGRHPRSSYGTLLSSDDVHRLCSKPQLLWLADPLLVYWIAHALMLAGRRLMDGDLVVFAIRDKVSLTTLTATVLLVLAAI